MAPYCLGALLVQHLVRHMQDSCVGNAHLACAGRHATQVNSCLD